MKATLLERMKLRDIPGRRDSVTSHDTRRLSSGSYKSDTYEPPDFTTAEDTPFEPKNREEALAAESQT